MSCDTSDEVESTTSGAHFKMKSNMMYKFFNEPVDALDLRLTKAEASLSSLPADPLFGQVVKEELGETKQSEGPIDYSEVQVFSPDSNSEDRVTSTKVNCDPDYEYEDAGEAEEFASHNQQTVDEESQLSAIQRVILKSNSLKSLRKGERFHPYHRISPIPWRSLLPPNKNRQTPDNMSPEPLDCGDYQYHSAIHLSPNIVKHTSQPYRSRYHHRHSSSISDFSANEHHNDEFERAGDEDSLLYHRRHREGQIWEDQRTSLRNLIKSTRYPGESECGTGFLNWPKENQKRKECESSINDIQTKHTHFKTEATDHDCIDQRISLAENSYQQNPLLLSCDRNHNSSDLLYCNEKRLRQLRSLHSNSCFQVPPSHEYLARSRELLNETRQSEDDDVQGRCKDYSSYRPCKGSPLTPHTEPSQRFSSVIVRNRLSAENSLPLPDRDFKVKEEESLERVEGKDERTELHTDVYNIENDYKPRRLQSYDQVPEQMEADRHWLNNIQRLRTGFAYQMLEAQRQQLQGSHYHDAMRLGQPNPEKLPYAPYQILNKSVPKLQYISKEEASPNKNINPHVLSSMDKFLPPGTRSPSETIALVNQMNSFLRRSEHPSYTSHNHLHSRVSSNSFPDQETYSKGYDNTLDNMAESGSKGKRGRPRKHAPKIPLPPLYVFIRNLLHNMAYNPSVIAWVDEQGGCFKVTNTTEFARTWGRMKSNRYISLDVTIGKG